MPKVTQSEPEQVAAASRKNPYAVIYFALVVYALLVVFTIHFHEAWADEAQSWLLGRDSSLARLWGTLLHYEGTPGLWQTLTHLLIRLGLPYSAYSLVSAVLELGAVYLVLRYAPLPLFIRLLLPFTYYFCYQYAVVARSYALIPPLLFAIAVLYPQAERRIASITLLLALLAAVSAHALLISGCIWVTLYGPLLFRARGPQRKKLAIASLLYACALLLLLICAWPAKDVAFAEHRGLSNLVLLPAIAKAGLAGAFAGYWILSLGVIALSAPLLARGGGWLFFTLAAVSICLFGTIVYTQLWHFGILFLAWVFAIWISAQRTRVDALAIAALIGAIGIQCFWTAAAIRYDWSHPYSGSLAAAQYFHRTGVPAGGLYAIGYSTTAIQPYFRSNIFSDFDDHGYWDWSKRNHANDPAALVASQRRELVLVGDKNPAEKQHWADLLSLLGYSPIQHFEGGTFWQTGVFEFESYDLYRQTASPRVSSEVDIANPSQAGQLLSGFYGIEGKTRWTAKNFSVLLKASPGDELVLKLFVSEAQLRNLGPVTLSANVGGHALPAQTFSKSGEYTYLAKIPDDVFTPGLAIVDFQIDKASVGLNGDARELGVIVTEAGFEPPSRAQ